MEQMFEHAKQHGHRFMAACDYAPIGAPKMYASYPACEDFITETLLKTERKHFYELIPEGQPCKFFLNMEWLEPHDQEKALALIHYVVNKLKKYAQVRAREMRARQTYEHISISVALIRLSVKRGFSYLALSRALVCTNIALYFLFYFASGKHTQPAPLQAIRPDYSSSKYI